ncbi:MAG: response regulator [Holosporales bacterium]|jgi:CheY-like chemotaxis protein
MSDNPAIILVVEDRPESNRLFCTIFEHAGYQTIPILDGKDVMPAIAKQRPDLILMDIGLPSISGAELTRRIKADPDLCSIPVLVCTAFVSGEEWKDLQTIGADHILPKPSDIKVMLGEAARLLAEAKAKKDSG